jgi:methionyl-tRNA formyltransferase
VDLKVVFWGSSFSEFSNRHFEALLDASCELIAVVDLPPGEQGSTNPMPADVPDFVNVARSMNIPVHSPHNTVAPLFRRRMRALAPDLFIAVGYAQILKPEILVVPKLFAANFHASLLPRYRGKHPVFWTLRAGERWAGLTVHLMDQGIDTGDILYQVKVRTRRNDTVTSLYKRIMDRSVGLVARLLDDAKAGTVPRHTQALESGSYYSSIKDEDFHIDWTWNGEKIRRCITMSPWKCFKTVAGHLLYFGQADWARDYPDGAQGTGLSGTGLSGRVLNIGRSRCIVAVSDGALWLGKARSEGGEKRSMASLCRQLGIKVGDVLA